MIIISLQISTKNPKQSMVNSIRSKEIKPEFHYPISTVIGIAVNDLTSCQYHELRFIASTPLMSNTTYSYIVFPRILERDTKYVTRNFGACPIRKIQNFEILAQNWDIRGFLEFESSFFSWNEFMIMIFW